jgi:gamma-glutamylcyclotransferase (GGCT)/AIG2-like uncharacterized protein YtfP
METDTKYLFVYGTLSTADNDFGTYLKANSKPVANGNFSGYLYDLGTYPGAVYDLRSNQQVYGKIVLLNDGPEILCEIDEYEGYGPNEKQPNLFVRKMIPVITETGVIDCWAYLYNLPTEGYWWVKPESCGGIKKVFVL